MNSLASISISAIKAIISSTSGPTMLIRIADAISQSIIMNIASLVTSFTLHAKIVPACFIGILISPCVGFFA